MEGTGTRMRHIKITDLALFDSEQLKKMIAQAAKF